MQVAVIILVNSAKSGRFHAGSGCETTITSVKVKISELPQNIGKK